MVKKYMPVPKTASEWKTLAADFQGLWDYPHCCGAIDGKHVVMVAPGNSGSLYYNYKGTFSVVLLALVGPNYEFITIDVGYYGHNNDAGIFSNSRFGRSFIGGTLSLPEPEVLPDAPSLGALPYVIVGDDAFPLTENLMKPYTRKNGMELSKKIYNYRLSRGRRIVESAFGIMAARWRVFQTKIAVLPETTVEIIKAATVLHNYMRETTTAAEQGSITPVELDECQTFAPLSSHGRRSGNRANDVRDSFKQYFVGEGSVPWQEDIVTRGLDTIDNR